MAATFGQFPANFRFCGAPGSPVFRRPITKGSWAGLLPVTAFIASEKEIEKYIIEKVQKFLKNLKDIFFKLKQKAKKKYAN